MIEGWRRLFLGPIQRTGFVVHRPKGHEHYDAELDKRWKCFRDPCLLHEVAPKDPGTVFLNCVSYGNAHVCEGDVCACGSLTYRKSTGSGWGR